MLRFRVAATLALACVVSFLAPGSSLRAESPNLVISQVYGGGGNTGATFTHDYIEIFNRGSAPASLSGLTLQYTSATGTGNFGANTGQLTPLPDVTLNPGQYFLVQEASNAAVGAPLPTPDATDATPINMSGTAGKVALVASAASLGCNGGSTPCSPAQLALIIDLVGYGGANFFEGSGPAPVLSNTTAAFRASNGCVDTDNNVADFSAAAPAPRNTSSALSACTGPTNPSGTGLASPASLTSGEITLLTVAVTPGANPTSTGLAVSADLSAIGGASSQPFFDDGTNGDVIVGDNLFSFRTTVSGTVGAKSLAAIITDAQGRSATTTIAITIEPPFTPIYELQGAGVTSTYAGQLVSTRGIVTALRSNGFFIQVRDGEGDANVQTSDGIFVFTSSNPTVVAAVGAEVRVIGTIQEFIPAADPGSPPMTEIASGPIVFTVSTGNALPASIRLEPSFTTTTGGFEQLERFEGMRVVADITAISGTAGSVSETNATGSSSGVFYAVLTGIQRPVREPGYDPTETLPPGAPCCVPAFDGNPERMRVDSDGQLTAPRIEIVAGQTITDFTGVLDYGFRAYTILPDPGIVYVPQGDDETVPVPEVQPNEFTVASYNLQRFFDAANDPNLGEPVLTAAAFERRLSKASLAIREILRMPDVLGVMEVENHSTLQAIAARVNADALGAGEPNPGYVAYLEEGNDPGGIDVGFLVKSSRVDVGSVEQIGKDALYFDVEHGELDLLNDRPPLVLRGAVHRQPGDSVFPVTVIVNHLRSLNGMTDSGLPGERVRDKRRLQAEFLANYIQVLQSSHSEDRIISVGDYNAFPFNDGFVDLIGTIKGTPTAPELVVSSSDDLVDPNLVNLGDALGALEDYSYVFDGNAQAIDHVLANRQAFKRLVRFAYAHLGADFPETFRSDATRPERLSDHDAAIAYFEIPAAPIPVTPPIGGIK